MIDPRGEGLTAGQTSWRTLRARLLRHALGMVVLGLGAIAGHAVAQTWVADLLAVQRMAAPPLPGTRKNEPGPARNASRVPKRRGTIVGQLPKVADTPRSSGKTAPVASLDPTWPTRGLPGAVARGDMDQVIQRLAQRDDPNYADARGRTAVMIAADAGHLAALKLMVEHGGDLRAHTVSGESSLMLAAARGHHDVVDWLLQQGVAIDLQDRSGRTALMLAARGDHGATAEELLGYHAKIELRTEQGYSALMVAAQQGAAKVIPRLLERGASLEHRDRAGATALALAVDGGHVEVAEQLLAAGAQVDAENHAGLTPLGYALSRRSGLSAEAQQRYDKVAQLLASQGADFRRLRADRIADILDPDRLDTLAIQHGVRPIRKDQHGPPVHVKATADGASVRILRALSRRRSRSMKARVDRRLEVLTRNRWRQGSVMRRIRISGLVPRKGQRFTLAGEVRGEWGFTVDDALLFLPEGRGRKDRARYVGALEQMRHAGRRVARLGPRSYHFRADSIDVTGLFAGGASLVVAAIDWGGSAMLTDVFLRVHGPGAVVALSKAEIEVLE